MIEKEHKQLVINACKHIAKQSAEHLQTMIVLEKTDYSELATIKGLLDAVLIMIEELPEKEQEQQNVKKELFQEKKKQAVSKRPLKNRGLNNPLFYSI